tara:strand:+ start:13721 stop:14647 length:927 start_codon:yes stop_codon:yes gene_type:complete
MTKELDIKILRNCFGKFATGITVITALAPDGTKIGLTVNSFSSLSLEPPLVLWSLDKKSKSLSAFIAATHFAINVLASDQMDISNNFARTSEDKFNNIKLSESKYDLPLLSGTVAHLECKNISTYEGGDHLIFIGEVEHFKTSNKKPLLYTNGQYTTAARHPAVKMSAPEEQDVSKKDDFIVPLLLRSYWEISDPFYRELQDEGMPISHARIIVHLSHSPNLTKAELSKAIRVDMTAVTTSVAWLCDNGYLNTLNNDQLTLSPAGNEHLKDVQLRAQRLEKEVLDGYSNEDVNMLKSMLKKIINRQDV